MFRPILPEPATSIVHLDQSVFYKTELGLQTLPLVVGEDVHHTIVSSVFFLFLMICTNTRMQANILQLITIKRSKTFFFPN